MGKIAKIFFMCLLLQLFWVFLVFAGGANEGNLYYFPRNVVDNMNVMIELNGEHSLAAGEIDKEFKNTSKDNLDAFRIRDSLKKLDRDSSNNEVTMTISSTNGWKFVHETNSTSTRDFSLSVFCVEMTENNRNYTAADAMEIELNKTNKLPSSEATVSFTKPSGVYKLVFPTTSFTRHEASLYAAFIRDFDFCIVLDELESGTYLETGYYMTTLNVTVSSYKKSDDTSFLGYHYHEENTGDLTAFSVTLRGYVGITPEMSTTPSFIVVSTEYTYSMDLAPVSPKQSPSAGYPIATISFSRSSLETTNPSNVNSNQKAGKYKIYISPTSDYNVAGKYYFIKNGTENFARTSDITVYYDLYIDGAKITNAPSNSSPYSLSPDFTSPKVSSSGALGGSDQWKYTWLLNKEIYLKVYDDDPDHYSPGFYYSYIYFTLVTET